MADAFQLPIAVRISDMYVHQKYSNLSKSFFYLEQSRVDLENFKSVKRLLRRVSKISQSPRLRRNTSRTELS